MYLWSVSVYCNKGTYRFPLVKMYFLNKMEIVGRDVLRETFERKFHISKACLQFRRKGNVLIFLVGLVFLLRP